MKKYVILLVFLLFLGLESWGAGTYAYYLLKVDSSSYKPSTVYAGNEVAIAVLLNNKTTTTATDINLSLSIGNYFEPIEVEKFIDRILPKETETVVFRLKAKKGIPAGTYTLTLKMDYDNLGERVSDTETISLTVSEIYRIAIERLIVSNYYPHINETVSIEAEIKNTGSIEARNVSIEFSLVGSSDFGKFIVLSETSRDLGQITPNKSKSVQFKLKPSEKIEPGVYSFKLNANCLDCDKNAEEKFSLHVYGYPELIISGVDYSIKGRDSKNITQGDSFSLSLQLDNLGKEDAKKVSIEIETDEEILGTKKSYIGSIEADDSSAGLFDLIVSENAKEGYHTISITITYLDELGKEKKLEETFSFYVSKMPEPNPYIPYVLVIVILIILYFIIKMVFRQLAIRKM